MKKFIPMTLTAVIAVAMVFAFAPSEFAQTTHVNTPITGSVVAASVAADTLGFTELDDSLAVDASTTIITNAFTLSIESTGSNDAIVFKGLLRGTDIAGATAFAPSLATTSFSVDVAGAAVGDFPICSLNTFTGTSGATPYIGEASMATDAVEVFITAATSTTIGAGALVIECLVIDIT
jgi:hypothetical protein